MLCDEVGGVRKYFCCRYSVVISDWIRRRVCFVLLLSYLLFLWDVVFIWKSNLRVNWRFSFEDSLDIFFKDEVRLLF